MKKRKKSRQCETLDDRERRRRETDAELVEYSRLIARAVFMAHESERLMSRLKSIGITVPDLY